MDALLQGAGPTVKTFLEDEILGSNGDYSEGRTSCMSLRDIVRSLVRVIVDPPASQLSSMTATEALLVDRQPVDSPEAASARVLAAYFEVILAANVRDLECGDNLQVNSSDEAETQELSGNNSRILISLDDVVNICLVLLDSRSNPVISVVFSFLCRQLQQREALARAVLTRRPDLLANLARVVKRALDGTSSGGRDLAKQAVDLWLALCGASYLPFRRWACRTLPRLEAVRSVLVLLCHHEDTSPGAVQILLLLSEDVSNYRILAREAGLLATLIRLIRDGLVAPGAPPGTATAPMTIVDRSIVKQRILLLAEAL
jgi:hypothetical protein